MINVSGTGTTQENVYLRLIKFYSLFIYSANSRHPGILPVVGVSANTYLSVFSRLGKKGNTHEKAQEGRTSGRGWGRAQVYTVRDAGNKREDIQQRSMDMRAENQLKGSSNEVTGWRVKKKMQDQNGENMGADVRNDFEVLWVDFSREN